jgi:hypothetical protein
MDLAQSTGAGSRGFLNPLDTDIYSSTRPLGAYSILTLRTDHCQRVKRAAQLRASFQFVEAARAHTAVAPCPHYLDGLLKAPHRVRLPQCRS